MCIGIAHSFTLYRGGVDLVAKEYKEFDAVKYFHLFPCENDIVCNRKKRFLVLQDAFSQFFGDSSFAILTCLCCL